MKNFIFLWCFFLGFSVPAQQWDWAKNVSYTITQEVNQLASDNNSNFYLSTNSNTSGSCITKFNTLGNELWKLYLNGGLTIKGIACSSSNVYITGAFSNTLHIGSYNLISNGSTDIFIACLTPNGNVVWVNNYGGLQQDIGNSLWTDAGGNVFITGQYFGTASFGTASLVAQGECNMFLAKIDHSGNILILKSAGTQNPSANGSAGKKIKTDVSGNIYVLGLCSDIVLDTIHRTGYGSSFICKFDSSANAQWVSITGDDYQPANDFVVDFSGNVVVTGDDNGNHQSKTYTRKYNVNGLAAWTQQIGTFNYGDWTNSNSIATNGNDFFIVGSAVNSYINSSRNSFFLLAAYDSAGTRTILDTLYCGDLFNGNNAEGKSVIRDSNGDFILAGNMTGNLQFGSNSLSTTTKQVFIVKFKENNLTASVSKNDFLIRNNIYPNPSQGFFTINMGDKMDANTFCIYDVFGNCILQKTCKSGQVEIDLSAQPKGVYLMEIKSQGQRSIKKIIIQ